MKLLFYDSESSGLPIWDRRSDHPSQPRIVEIAAELTNAQGRMISMMSTLIKPDGWTIDPDAEAVHDISTNYARDNGMKIETALETFLALWALADMRVAHNQAFDERMLRHEIIRAHDRATADIWKDGSVTKGGVQKFCTMHSAKHIVGATNVKGKIKNPTLGEAYKHFTGEDAEDSHRALGDMLSCKAVYFGILRYSEENPTEPEKAKDSATADMFNPAEI